MATTKSGESHRARKDLFAKGIKRGWLTVAEIEQALPPHTMSPAERWLLYYSLRAADVEVRGATGEAVEPPEPR